MANKRRQPGRRRPEHHRPTPKPAGQDSPLATAHGLWAAGRREEAVDHLRDLLRASPGDDHRARYALAGFLLFLDRDDELARLLGQYPDDASAAWSYTRALLAFRRQGDTIDSRRLLKAAWKANKHVPAYLTGRKFPPSRQPRSYKPGDVAEALNYVGSFMAGWRETAGAVAWLRANDRSREKREAAPARGPLGLVKKWLQERLPQQPGVWQAEFRQTPTWVRIAGEPVRPWLILVTSQSGDAVLAHQILEEAPSSALLFDTLVQAMQHPLAGQPHRPAELQVRPDPLWDALRPHFQEVGVTLSTAERLDHVESVLAELSEHTGVKPEPGLLDMPGVGPAQAAGFYEAAAFFFEQRPWKKVGHEAAIRVECDKFTGGPWYAVLMGQSGLSIGLALYDDLQTLKRILTGEGGDEENARETVATSVTFGEEWDVPVADLEAARRYGWKVARPDAYPEIIHKERGLSCRPPLAWELELMEGCLRAVPGFVSRRQDDPAREELTVATAGGDLRLVLSWVVE